MAKRIFKRWVVLAVALGALAATVACTSGSGGVARSGLPSVIEATISKAPKVWEPVTITCTLTNNNSTRPYLNVEAWISLVEYRPNVVYLDGDMYWEGTINPGETATFSAVVAYTEEGIGAGYCRTRFLRQGSGVFDPPVPLGHVSPSLPPNAFLTGLAPIVKNSPIVTKQVNEPLLLVITSKAELDQAVANGFFPPEGKFEWRKVFETNFAAQFLVAVYGATGPTTGYGVTPILYGVWVKGSSVIIDVNQAKPPETVGATNPSTPLMVLMTARANLPPGPLRFVVSQNCVEVEVTVTFATRPDCVESASVVADVGGIGPHPVDQERWQRGLEEEAMQ